MVKRCHFGVVGSGNSFGRIAVHIVWGLCALGFIIECWVDDLIYLGSTKQIAAGQRAAAMLAELYEFFWKLPKRVGPADVVRWIGFLFDLPNQQMQLTAEFLAKLRAFIHATSWVSRSSQRVASLQPPWPDWAGRTGDPQRSTTLLSPEGDLQRSSTTGSPSTACGARRLGARFPRGQGRSSLVS